MATTYTITAKNAEYSGDVAGVAFSRGVGEAVDPPPNVLAYFERHGYDVAKKIGGRRAAAKPEPKKEENPPKDGDPKKDGEQSGNGPKE